jgi:hypothetical protein
MDKESNFTQFYTSSKLSSLLLLELTSSSSVPLLLPLLLLPITASSNLHTLELSSNPTPSASSLVSPE